MMGFGSRWALGATNDTDWNSMADFMKEMMRPYQSGGGLVFWQLHWLFELITWFLIIALLAALVRYFWRKGEKK